MDAEMAQSGRPRGHGRAQKRRPGATCASLFTRRGATPEPFPEHAENLAFSKSPQQIPHDEVLTL